MAASRAGIAPDERDTRSCAILAVIVLGGVALRLFAARHPEFTDESFHVRWAFDALHGRPWQSVIEHGKKPLHFLLIAPFVALFENAVFAARAVSIAFGAATIALAFAVTRRLFGERAGVVAAAMAASVPYLVIFDARVGQEAILGAAGLGVLWLSVRLGDSATRRGAVFAGAGLGAVFGLALATKETAAAFAILPVAAMIDRHRRGDALPGAGLAAALAVAAIAFAGVIVPAYLATGRGLIVDGEYVQGGRAAVIASNARMYAASVGLYLGPLIFVPLAFFAGSLRRARTGEAFMAGAGVAAFAAALSVFVLVGAKSFPRHLAAFAPLLLPAAARGAMLMRDTLAARGIPRGVIAAALAASALGPSAMHAADPSRAPLVAEDREAFVTGWPSGYGLAEVLSFVDGRAGARPVAVIAPPLAGMPLDALGWRYRSGRRVAVVESGDVLSSPYCGSRLAADLAGREVFIIVNQPAVPLAPVAEMNPGRAAFVAARPGNESRMVLYEPICAEGDAPAPPLRAGRTPRVMSAISGVSRR
ncbi:glycosyltransferase family 39 protein [bacterium]|nr:glycosyltransferase family 39 protein [bacterium]